VEHEHGRNTVREIEKNIELWPLEVDVTRVEERLDHPGDLGLFPGISSRDDEAASPRPGRRPSTGAW
jgi:hypothetical protein